MMKTCWTMFLLLPALALRSQSVVYLKDPHIREQQRRMVYANWGKFLPEPDYFLGIQTNIHYTMVWGWLAPARNRKYRRGPDIRPLGPKGMQTQRLLLSAQMLESSRKKKVLTDSIAALARRELYGHSALFAGIDPLWRLYYRKQLQPVEAFRPELVLAGLDTGQRNYLQNSRLPDWYGDEMTRLQERLKQIFTTDMERGARILGYHRLLLDYRVLQSRWDAQCNRAARLWALKATGENSRYAGLRHGTGVSARYTDQSELMRRTIRNAYTRTNP